MAVLSYLDLISEIGAEEPDPATINMDHGEIYLIPEACWNTYFQGLGKDTSFSMPRKMLLEIAELYKEGIMRRGHFYTENKMPKKAKNYERIIGMRSNVARIGLMGTRFRGVHGELSRQSRSARHLMTAMCVLNPRIRKSTTTAYRALSTSRGARKGSHDTKAGYLRRNAKLLIFSSRARATEKCKYERGAFISEALSKSTSGQNTWDCSSAFQTRKRLWSI